MLWGTESFIGCRGFALRGSTPRQRRSADGRTWRVWLSCPFGFFFILFVDSVVLPFGDGGARCAAVPGFATNSLRRGAVRR